MPKRESIIESVTLLNSDLFVDKRGYSYGKYNGKCLSTYKVNFVQKNISLSKKGTIRGAQWQSNPKDQDKLVTCVDGKVFDIYVDSRKESKTFGDYCSDLLNSDENKSLLVPKLFTTEVIFVD
jgi:dTDP-4-dehydrorhamnose 3,5-epimerase